MAEKALRCNLRACFFKNFLGGMPPDPLALACFAHFSEALTAIPLAGPIKSCFRRPCCVIAFEQCVNCAKVCVNYVKVCHSLWTMCELCLSVRELCQSVCELCHSL